MFIFKWFLLDAWPIKKKCDDIITRPAAENERTVYFAFFFSYKHLYVFLMAIPFGFAVRPDAVESIDYDFYVWCFDVYGKSVRKEFRVYRGGIL